MHRERHICVNTSNAGFSRIQTSVKTLYDLMLSKSTLFRPKLFIHFLEDFLSKNHHWYFLSMLFRALFTFWKTSESPSTSPGVSMLNSDKDLANLWSSRRTCLRRPNRRAAAIIAPNKATTGKKASMPLWIEATSLSHLWTNAGMITPSAREVSVSWVSKEVVGTDVDEGVAEIICVVAAVVTTTQTEATIIAEAMMTTFILKEGLSETLEKSWRVSLIERLLVCLKLKVLSRANFEQFFYSKIASVKWIW